MLRVSGTARIYFFKGVILSAYLLHLLLHLHNNTFCKSSQLFTLGKHYAILNLDLITVLIDIVKDTAAGQQFVSNCALWNDAVYKKDTRLLSIFSLFFKPGEPELAEGALFTKLLNEFGEFSAGSEAEQISPTFLVVDKDIVFQKTRLYAGASNRLEMILRANNINTVIIVCY